MRVRLKRSIVLAVLALGTAVPLHAQTGFDDLGAGIGVTIPDGYGGLNWTDFLHTDGDASVYQNTGYDHGTVSHPNVAFNDGGGPAEFSSASTFTFNSAYLTAAWNDGLNLAVYGFHAGTQIFSQALVLNTSGPIFATFDWQNVDLVRFVASGGTHHDGLAGLGTHFVMDDLAINGAVQGMPATTTPEPVSMALLGTGLAGVSAVLRRRKKSAELA